jgi:hypothetical protein
MSKIPMMGAPIGPTREARSSGLTGRP